MPVVYILRCGDDTYYTGWTTRIERRVMLHSQGKASRYTRSRKPVTLVYVEEVADKSQALRREHAIKKMDRNGKEALIQSIQRPTSL